MSDTAADRLQRRGKESRDHVLELVEAMLRREEPHTVQDMIEGLAQDDDALGMAALLLMQAVTEWAERTGRPVGACLGVLRKPRLRAV